MERPSCWRHSFQGTIHLLLSCPYPLASGKDAQVRRPKNLKQPLSKVRFSSTEDAIRRAHHAAHSARGPKDLHLAVRKKHEGDHPNIAMALKASCEQAVVLSGSRE